MGKRAIVLGTVCSIVLVVVFFFEFFMLSTPAQPTPIQELWAHYFNWVDTNKTVIVEGNLYYVSNNPYISPYNYQIVSFGASGIGYPTTFGVHWTGANESGRPVIVRGLVREGTDYLPDNRTTIGMPLPYIEAQTIIPIPNDTS